VIYARDHPEKLEHCRVVKDEESDVVIGFIQLQMPGDRGDFSFPDSSLRHKLLTGETCVEQYIACHPDHMGKGIGSKLLEHGPLISAGTNV
jgi:GNAT superfamily N-acetyltransferase